MNPIAEALRDIIAKHKDAKGHGSEPRGGAARPTLTHEHRAALAEYKGSDPHHNAIGLNGALRDRVPLDAHQSARVREIDDAFDHHTKLAAPATLYRGVSERPQFDAHGRMYHAGFTSTTSDRDVAEMYSTLTTDHGHTLEIRMPKGARLVGVDQHAGTFDGESTIGREHEYLLPRGAGFRHISSSGTHHVVEYTGNGSRWGLGGPSHLPDGTPFAKGPQFLEAAAKDLTPGDVHVNGPMGDPKKRKRIADTLRAVLEKDAGLYVCRPVTPETDAALREWAAGFGAVLQPNLHVTVVHSRVTIPWDLDPTPLTVPRSQLTGFKLLGQDEAQALRFSSPALQRRWSAARSAGAVWDYPAFLPHVTLWCGGSRGVPLRLPPFGLTFGPEIAAPLDRDVFEQAPAAWIVKAGLIAWDPSQHPKGAGGKFVSGGGGASKKPKPAPALHSPAYEQWIVAGKPSPVPPHLAFGMSGAEYTAAVNHAHGLHADFLASKAPKGLPAAFEETAGNAPKPSAPVMFTGKEGNIGKFQQKLVDSLSGAQNGAEVANIKLPLSASKVVKEYQKNLLAYHGTADQKVEYIPWEKKPPKLTTTPATEKLVAGVEAKAAVHAKPALPTAPAVDTNYPADQQKLFTNKIGQLQAAYHSENPAEALAVVPVYAPALTAYKAKLASQISAWEDTKPVTPVGVGATVSTLKVLGSTAAPEHVPFPTRVHGDFSQAAYTYRTALSTTEKAALSSYQGSGYHHINSELRNNPTANSATHQALDRVLHGASLPMDTKVIRNLHSLDLVKKAKSLVGRVVEDPAYMSTSLTGGFANHSSVSLHLNLPKGTKGLYLNSGGGTSAYEYEVLLARRTRYRVDKVEHTGNGVRIYGTVLTPNKQPNIPSGK